MREDILREVQETLARMSLPELTELMHRVADEIQIRMMQAAGSD